MSDSDKLKEVREVLKDPFAEYPTLKDRERKALKLVAEGRPGPWARRLRNLFGFAPR